MATSAARREPYIGEKRKFLRNGFGVYVYENHFFRYEGEWKNGKKHGHGKLVMKDGTYYEGQFIDGEINGHGTKFFSGTNCIYTGQFVNGEMHGHGVMQYADGSVYEGQWVKNKKQGFGTLRTSPKEVYKGQFDHHHRNGEGCQTYEGKHILSNGDWYEGYWVMDKRHGHGELHCADGTLYVGQFAEDMYHGEGKMQHASGMLYVGEWLHGFPSRLATKLVIAVEESPLIIRQGQPFKIAVTCQDDDGFEVEEDQGREIQVTAGFKYFPPKQGSMLFDMIEDVEEKPIPTPFGYEVVSYPLTDQLSEEEVLAEDEKGEKGGKDEDGEDKGEGEGEGEAPEPAEGGEGGEEEGKEAGGQAALKEEEEVAPAAEASAPAGPAGSNPPSPIQDPNQDTMPEPNPTQRTLTPVEATPLPPPVATKRTEGGGVEWENLQLSPPPPLYRPFVAMDEEKKSNKKMSLKDKFELCYGLLPTPTQSCAMACCQLLHRAVLWPAANSYIELWPVANSYIELWPVANSYTELCYAVLWPVANSYIELWPVANSYIELCYGLLPTPTQSCAMACCHLLHRAVLSPVANSYIELCYRLLPTPTQGKLQSYKKRGSQIKLGDNKEKTNVADEKFARTGEYVLMVQDVTNPPFLGKRLEPAFLLLKLKRPKKVIVKKKKWDTDRHIAASMHSRIYNSLANL
ncbi:uncharacterized protein LOC143300288 [Babylonia areolata]|uniref:uncharacterized protein LOC143300288 n=1 Tax=Babylonia areolata TaxID=304850 RepID=UPI003FD1E3E6